MQRRHFYKLSYKTIIISRNLCKNKLVMAVVIILLSSRTQQDFYMSLNRFVELVKSYQWVSDRIETK